MYSMGTVSGLAAIMSSMEYEICILLEHHYVNFRIPLFVYHMYVCARTPYVTKDFFFSIYDLLISDWNQVITCKANLNIILIVRIGGIYTGINTKQKVNCLFFFQLPTSHFTSLSDINILYTVKYFHVFISICLNFIL